MDNYNNKLEIILGGNTFTIPLLVARENRIIDPIILKLLPLFAKWQQQPVEALASIGQPEYSDLLEMVYIAIAREHKEMTREKLLDMPITLSELISAFHVIAQQTGIFQKSAIKDDNRVGEALPPESPL